MDSLFLKKYAAFISANFQGFFLIYFADLAIIEVAMAILLCLGLGFLILKSWERRKRYRYLDFVLVTLSVGGLGMVLGQWLDLQISPMHHAHIASQHSWQHLFSCQTGLMLVFCIFACEVLCSHHCANLSVRKRILGSFECHVSMLAGMFIGGYLLVPALAALIKTSLLSMHLSMLMGMVAGMWIGLIVMDSKSSGHHNSLAQFRQKACPERSRMDQQRS